MLTNVRREKKCSSVEAYPGYEVVYILHCNSGRQQFEMPPQKIPTGSGKTATRLPTRNQMTEVSMIMAAAISILNVF